MSLLSNLDITRILEYECGECFNQKKTLYIVLGLLGDFDSFEYVQSLIPCLDSFKKSDIDLMVVAIGDNESKKAFLDYTKFPSQNLKVVHNISLHRKLGLDSGLELPLPSLLNLIIMCLGIKSPGTISEVFRGYLGDRRGKKLFKTGDIISFSKYIVFKAELFDLLGKDGFLRPFELASLRLMNMIEIISKWRIYMIDDIYLTQRSGTFLVDKNGEMIYSYKSNSLLGFSETMHNPLEFLDKLI